MSTINQNKSSPSRGTIVGKVIHGIGKFYVDVLHFKPRLDKPRHKGLCIAEGIFSVAIFVTSIVPILMDEGSAMALSFFYNSWSYFRIAVQSLIKALDVRDDIAKNANTYKQRDGIIGSSYYLIFFIVLVANVFIIFVVLIGEKFVLSTRTVGTFLVLFYLLILYVDIEDIVIYAHDAYIEPFADRELFKI